MDFTERGGANGLVSGEQREEQKLYSFATVYRPDLYNKTNYKVFGKPNYLP